MKIKKLFSALLAVLFVLSAFIHPSHAHTTSQSDQILSVPGESHLLGGEKYGWIIDESAHLIGDNYYSFWKHHEFYYFKDYQNNDPYHPLFTPTVRGIVNRGASMWRAEMGFWFEVKVSGINYNSDSWIETISDPAIDAVAVFDPLNVNSSGHITKWCIRVNVAKPSNELNDTTLAHEFGHALGLLDLRESYNRNKVMYFRTYGRTATKPTRHEGYAARITTGNGHQTHTWTGGYQYLGAIGGVCYHTTKCKDCNGPSVMHKVRCTYNANHVCKHCGGRPTA